MGARLHAYPPAAGVIGLPDAGPAEDDPAGWEVGALDVPHQPLGVDVLVIDVGDRGVDRLAQIVRRNVRGHPDSDAGRAVDEQVREPRGQNKWFLALPVVVWGEVDAVHVEVAQHLAGYPRQARLGVAFGGRRIVIDRTEVTLRVDQL